MAKRSTTWVKLTNRTNGKFCHVKAEVRTHGKTYICVCTSQQYNRAIEKLDNGSVTASSGLIVETRAGRPYACVDAE